MPSTFFNRVATKATSVRALMALGSLTLVGVALLFAEWRFITDPQTPPQDIKDLLLFLSAGVLTLLTTATTMYFQRPDRTAPQQETRP